MLLTAIPADGSARVGPEKLWPTAWYGFVAAQVTAIIRSATVELDNQVGHGAAASTFRFRSLGGTRDPRRIGTAYARIACSEQKIFDPGGVATGLGLSRKGCRLKRLAKSPGIQGRRVSSPVPQSLPTWEAGQPAGNIAGARAAMPGKLPSARGLGENEGAQCRCRAVAGSAGSPVLSQLASSAWLRYM
jgi:hypothetical protein